MIRFPDRYRVRNGPLATVDGEPRGAFILPPLKFAKLRVIADIRGEWEHASVTVDRGNRCPTWEEMCAVKDAFWDPEDEVFQFHPAHSNYVNLHEYCLHLWRRVNGLTLGPPVNGVSL